MNDNKEKYAGIPEFLWKFDHSAKEQNNKEAEAKKSNNDDKYGDMPEFLRKFDYSAKEQNNNTQEENKQNVVSKQPQIQEEPSTENNANVTEERAVELNLDDLVHYKNQPFHTHTEQEMKDLKESIERIGLQNPIIVRKNNTGKYEILSGNNRADAFRELGRTTISAKIVDVDDDMAELIMIDTNLVQRQNLHIMERAKAYKLKEEIKRAKKWNTEDEKIALSNNEIEKIKENEINRTFYCYLALNNLIQELQNKCDDGTLSVKAGEQLSKLNEKQQKQIYNSIGQTNISESKAKDLRKVAEENPNNFNEDTIRKTLLNKGNTLKPSIHFTKKEMNKYFSKYKSNDEIKKHIIFLLDKEKNNEKNKKEN